MRDLLLKTAEQAASWLESLDDRPVAARASLEELRSALGRPLADEGLADETVIEELMQDVSGGLMGSTGGRFFGWVIGGARPAGVAADWLATTWDQNAAMYATSPAAAVVEEVAGRWMKEILQLPQESSFAFVTGCQMAHFTCLAAARNRLLEQGGWDVEVKGLVGAPQMSVVTGEHGHASIDRVVRMLGLGSENLHTLGTTSDGGLDLLSLDQELARHAHTPTVVCLQAGDINTGRFDNFREAIPVVRRHPRSWIHVDGAFGLFAAASPEHSHLTAGIEGADSWATNGRKWLNTPFDSGYAFVRHPDPHRAAMSIRASYLTHNDTKTRDEIDWNPEWSRRARGLATYATLRSLGRKGVAEIVQNCCRHALRLTREIGALEGAELLHEPQLNQGLVRFLDTRGDDHDQRTDQVIERIQAEGTAWFGGTTWHGQRAMRISVCNANTTDRDVDLSVAAVARVLSGTA